jgi:hypothetical protein
LDVLLAPCIRGYPSMLYRDIARQGNGSRAVIGGELRYVLARAPDARADLAAELPAVGQ